MSHEFPLFFLVVEPDTVNHMCWWDGDIPYFTKWYTMLLWYYYLYGILNPFTELSVWFLYHYHIPFNPITVYSHYIPEFPKFSKWIALLKPTYFWGNYNKSLTWNKVLLGYFPYTNHHSSEGNQWGRYLFDPYADKICRPRLRSSPFEILLNCALWGELWAQSSARELWWFDGSNHQIAVNPGFKLITPHGLIAEPCFIWQSKSVSHCFTFHILVLGDPPGFRPASGVNFPATGKTTHTMSAAESMAHG
jgi:hypothetical protein